MMKLKQLQREQKEQLLKAIAHLQYSYKKILLLPVEIDTLDEEMLETWESFSARFSRVADIFLTKYLRASVTIDDPGFRGSFRDCLDQAEKLGIINNVEDWMAIRELRNISAHEYTEKDLSHFFEKLRQVAPQLLAIQTILE